MNFVAFGVGNFHFSLSDSWVGAVSYGDYMAEVRKTLERLPFVGDIQGLAPIRGKSWVINDDIHPPYPRIKDGENPVPLVLGGEFSFILHIPGRVLSTLPPFRGMRHSRMLPEKFRVHMRHGYHSSLCFVECLDAREGVEPSDAVVAAREILEQEIPKVDTRVVFDCLGPSPFHADFFLSKAEDADKSAPAITREIVRQPGYDLVLFRYNPHKFASCDEAKEALFRELDHEVSIFYYIVAKRVQLMLKWGDLEELIDELAKSESDGPFGWERLTGKSRSVKKAAQSIGLLRIQEVSDFAEIERVFSEQYQEEGFIKELVQKEREDMPRYPLNEAKDLIDFFERKSSKSVELWVLIVAALLSAIVGGMIGNLL